MANTDKFEMIANMYDTPERIQIAKVSSDAIREYVVDLQALMPRSLVYYSKFANEIRRPNVRSH